jgi:hypothetical protein
MYFYPPSLCLFPRSGMSCNLGSYFCIGRRLYIGCMKVVHKDLEFSICNISCFV